MLEIFWFCFQFLLDKRLLLPKIKFYRPCVRGLASGWLQNGYKSEEKTTSQFADMKSSSIFLTLLFLLSSYKSKFHVNIMTGTGVVTISVYNGLTRNWEIGNTPACVLPNILRLGRVRNTKFCMNVSNEMLLNAAKCQDYSFYRFWVIKGKPTGMGWEGSNFKPTQVRVNVFIVDLTLIRCLPNWLSFTRSRVNGLTNFMPLVSFYASWRYHKSSGFPFSGGKERAQLHEMG